MAWWDKMVGGAISGGAVGSAGGPWGVAIGAGVGAIVGLAGHYQEEKAKKASKERLAEIAALFDRIKPPGYDLSINEPPELHERTLMMPRFQRELARTKFDKREIRQIGKFLPQFPQLIKEKAPQLLEGSKEYKEGMAAQKRALKEFEKISERTSDPRWRALVERAKKRTQSEAQSRGQTIQTQMARRGLAGSGLEMAAQIGSSAEAMDRLGEIEMQAASDAYRNRLEALARGADLGRSISQQEMEKERHNLGLINDFNRRMAANRQRLEEARAAGLSEAQLFNLRERQRIEEMNRARADQIARVEAEEDRMNTQRQDEMARFRYGERKSQRDYENRLAMYRAEWARREKERQNRLKRQQYQDQMERARGRAGIMEAGRQEDLGSARGDIAGMRALGDMIAMGAGMMGGSNTDKYKSRYGSDADWYRDRDVYNARTKRRYGYRPYRR